MYSRKLTTKVTALFLVMIMAISMLPISAIQASATTGAQLTIDVVTGIPGETVELKAVLSNAPDVKSMAVSDITYDSGKMTLTKVEWLCDAEIKNWNSSQGRGVLTFGENTNANGAILKMTFKIADIVEDSDVNVSCSIIVKAMNASHDEEPVATTVIPGVVEIRNEIPGDMDGNEKVNSDDAVYLLYHTLFGKEEYPIKQSGDIDGNSKTDSNDAVYLLYHVLFGEDDYPFPDHCVHSLDYFAEKAATCTDGGNEAYWYCSKCGKYFADANGNTEISLADTVIAAKGHTEVEIPAVAPTYDEEGSTAGVKCSVCHEIIIQPTKVPPLQPDEISIIYKYDTIAGDVYLQSAVAKAISEGKITTHETKDVTSAPYEVPFVNNDPIPGYEFQGWYKSTANDAEKVETIAQGTVGNVTLYATWEKTPYKVTYIAPLKPINGEENKKYTDRTIDQTTILPEEAVMEVPNYYFMGWSDGSGKIINQINPGVGNITVYANWTSATRNIAVATDYKNQKPIILEPKDIGENQYLFVYDIGYIDRVPVEIIKDPIYNSGIYKFTVESFESATIGAGNEKEINSTIANATTHSSSWTLSEEWNELITEVNGKEQSMEQGKVVAISDGSSKAYSSSASTYSGNSFHTSNDKFVSSKTITDDSYNNSASVEAGLSYGPAKVSAKISGEQAHSEHQEDYSESKSSLEVSAEWNSTQGYSVSGESFVNTTKTESVLEGAKNTWGLEISKAIKDLESRTEDETSSTTSTEGHKSIIAFHNEETKGNSETIERTFTDIGYYRYALFAKVHVFAAVGYDMETGAYFVNTYSVVDDNMVYDFDYSSEVSFNEYDNAVLPFEVPVFVYDYIFANNAKTKDVNISRDGVVMEYTGNATNIRIPDYATFNNDDYSYVIVPVVGIKEGLFNGKTDITSVKLGKFIESIPNNAFAGCTALEKVEYNAEILSSIGDNAFDGCVSLNSLEIGNANGCKVTNIGTDAFKNVPNVKIYAVNADVAEKAVSCGANNVSVYMKHLSDSEIAKLSGKTLMPSSTTTSFALYGADKVYNNLSIESKAMTATVINGLTLANNTRIPLILESATVEFNRVNINNAPGIAIQFKADQTAVTIKSVNNISTNGKIAVLGKNLTMSRVSGEYSEFNVPNGDFVVCGNIDALRNFAYLKITDGEIRSVSQTEYENMLKTHNIYFDANGGEVGTNSLSVTYNSPIGVLPIPSKDNCTFLGWFKEDGTQVVEGNVFTNMADITVKAHWLTDYTLSTLVPVGSEIVSEKWTYTRTETTESTEDSMAGWTPTGDYWRKTGSGSTNYASFPSGYDTNNTYYKNFAKSAYSAYDNGRTKREVTNNWAGYVYWHWMYSTLDNGTATRAIYNKYGYGPDNGFLYQYFYAFTSTKGNYDSDKYYCNSQNITNYIVFDQKTLNAECGGATRWFRFDYYTSSYTDYEKVYQYQKITTENESMTQIYDGGEISNVQHYVRYIQK